MTKQTESGHAKNVAMLNQLIGVCTTFGDAYNPSKSIMKLKGLRQLHADAVAALQQVTLAKTVLNNATNARELAFAELKPLSVKIVNALAATNATKLTIDDAKSAKRRIQGKRAVPKPKPSAGQEPVSPGLEGEQKTYNSVSQQSYDKLLENFQALVTTVTNEPSYEPNEAELSQEGLDERLKALRLANLNVITASAELDSLRAGRNAILYGADTGLVDVGNAVKKYVRSVFGNASSEGKRVGKFRFTSRF